MEKNDKIALGLLGLGVVAGVAILANQKPATAAGGPLPPGYNLGVSLIHLESDATIWELNVISNDMKGNLGTNYIPVTQAAVFKIPSTWVLPLKIMLTVYKDTFPNDPSALTQILYVQSYNTIDYFTGQPDPTYKPIFIASLGNLSFDATSLQFANLP